ncbi:UbiA prenyltransferase family-domain-containing protein [Hypoxylon sp. FL0543]|nr:UbiA prenyltransferase family-domain-containing protein [Hypoxylon sp. FL0543]
MASKIPPYRTPKNFILSSIEKINDYPINPRYLATIQETIGRSIYFGHTLWLFTLSDLKTIVVPSTIFGITNSLTISKYHVVPDQPIQDRHLLCRSLMALLWVWINLVPFTIGNQTTASSIAEDAINKPWRPLPSRRLSSSHARIMMPFFYVVAQIFNIYTGSGIRQGVCLFLLGVWYNNLGGADYHPLIRNAINALGYVCFTSGAMEAALGMPLPFCTSSRLVEWLGVIAGIIVTTVHVHDMYDQEGDALRGRRTLPLVIGDMLARWVTAFWMLIWGICCPIFCGTGFIAQVSGLVLSLSVALRTLLYRNVSSDRLTCLTWNIWMSFVYLLPLFARE